MENLKQDRHSRDKYLNQLLLEYESGVLTTRLQRSTSRIMRLIRVCNFLQPPGTSVLLGPNILCCTSISSPLISVLTLD
jgi:hypothetical protein